MPHQAQPSGSGFGQWDQPPAADVPSKRDLTSWWKQFKRSNQKKDDDKEPERPRGIFGVPLQDSIKYANVAISLFNEKGESYIYGYVPIVVAKCGVFLKEKAIDVEGIFRLSGSEKRIKELRSAFNSPDRYGKGLDWTGYTVHDAANILRRYFNQLPEPIIPLEFYQLFRTPLCNHQAQAVGPMDGQKDSVGDFDMDTAIRKYQRLITELPPLNRQLLLYILDLLAVFASKSDLNKMTTPNLAAIFQPGILSHPIHDMAPPEYRLSQDVLIFLIENQDNFLIGMQGTAADAKTVEEVESGPPTPSGRAPTTPIRSKTNVDRSSSNASAGAESVRKQGIVRRNVSVSSRKSKASVAPSPVSTQYSSGVHRSNTVPSKKSPAVSGKRFSRDAHDQQSPVDAPKSSVVTSISIAEPANHLPRPTHIVSPPSSEGTAPLAPPASGTSSNGLLHHDQAPYVAGLLPHHHTPPKPRAESFERDTTGFRSFSSMFQSSPQSDSDVKERRRPNKLQKRRAPSTNPSAASSTNSLHASHVAGPPSPLPTGLAAGTPVNDYGPHIAPIAETPSPKTTASANAPGSSMSPSTSMLSHSTLSVAYSELEHGDDAVAAAENGEANGKRGRLLAHWREASKPVVEHNVAPISGSEQNVSSVASNGGRKSLNLDHQHQAINLTPAWVESKDGDKKNPFGWFRGKIADRKEREEAKQRAKSPPSSCADPSSPTSRAERFGHRSTPSLAAFTHRRGRSVEQIRLAAGSPPPPPHALRAKEDEAKQVPTPPLQTEPEEVTPAQTPSVASIVLFDSARASTNTAIAAKTAPVDPPSDALANNLPSVLAPLPSPTPPPVPHHVQCDDEGRLTTTLPSGSPKKQQQQQKVRSMLDV